MYSITKLLTHPIVFCRVNFSCLGLLAKGRNIPTITTGPSPNRYPVSVGLSGSEPGDEFTPDDPLAQLYPIDLPDDRSVAANNPASPHPAGDKLGVFAATDALRLAHGWSTDRVCSATRNGYANDVNELGFACGVWGDSREEGDVRIAELLLQLGLDPNVRAYRGMFPLYTAAMNNDYALCETLLKYGADKEMFITTYNGIMKPVDAVRDPQVKNLIENWSPHKQRLDEKHKEGVSSLFEAFELDDMPDVDRNALVNEMTHFQHRTASEENHPNMYALTSEVDRKMTELAKEREDSVKKASVLTECELAMIAVLVDCVTIVVSMLGLNVNQGERIIIMREVEYTFSESVAGTPFVAELTGYFNDMMRAEFMGVDQVWQLFNVLKVLHKLDAIRNVVYGIIQRMSWWERGYTLATACGTIATYFFTDGVAFVVSAMTFILTVPDLIINVEKAIKKCKL